MNSLRPLVLCLLLCLVQVFFAENSLAAEADPSFALDKEALLKRIPAKKWRVAYIEGGHYTDYQNILVATTRALADMGLIAKGDAPIDVASDNTRPIWEWLASNAGGKHIEFVRDAYYSANWEKEQRLANKEALLKRIREQGDIDMVLAFGTWAGIDMQDEKVIPVFSMSVTDAVQAGIALSLDDSGQDNLHTQVDPDRYQRQLFVFHDLFKFKTLGIAYEDSPEGRSDISLDALEKASATLGIRLVRCTTALNVPPNQSFANLKQCLKSLSTTSDAVYLTTNSGMQWNRMKELLQPLIDAGVPSFSQSGIEETKLGVLMSLSQNSFASEGQFGAYSIAQVMAGTKPRLVPQVFDSPIGLVLNLEMARRIGWTPSFDVLLAVDAIYYDIKNAGE